MLSFIVPAYNEEWELPSTIRAIQRAIAESGMAEYELIVVDDGSVDGTAQIAREASAKLVSINRRHIAASRNAGGQAAAGEVLFFVDADTRIKGKHVTDALAALRAGYSGGSARLTTDEIPRWGRILMKIFSTIYFANKLGAGAFLFTTRANFQEVGGFDEQYFVGEEIYFTQALKKLGRFKILREPMITSGRKLRMYSASHILSRSFAIIIRGPRAARNRDRLDLWYNGERENT
jgi:glycosyltransferase involved in cell wall biosynthesis